ncbi:hypothetical protein TD95_000991 [Thielaviopsis punctulata]|uniref:Ubiquinol-cytochrome c chaperone domain-containing protein n=1 Tax=Thielaviopsis punctulata TaxID=72032 RepID=A0A0F4ZDC5_9PEZI|nr:hypothetical protein TD95_000991 [Thielaviopsis punctulata]
MAVPRHLSRAVPRRLTTPFAACRGYATSGKPAISPADLPPMPKRSLPKGITLPRDAYAGLAKSKLAQQYQKLSATESAYAQCKTAADYKVPIEKRRKEEVEMTAEGEEIGESLGPWHEAFGLLPTFSTWSQVTMLHMYLLFARLRCLDKEEARSWQHQLSDHFFFDCERVMDVNHGLTSAAMRQRYLKDIFVQWRGIIMAYDEGLVRGDAVLAAAVWRNLFKAREDVDVRHVAAIVAWIRATMKELERRSDEEVLIGGALFKKSPMEEYALVDRPSAMLTEKTAAEKEVESKA